MACRFQKDDFVRDIAGGPKNMIGMVEEVTPNRWEPGFQVLVFWPFRPRGHRSWQYDKYLELVEGDNRDLTKDL